MRFKISICIPIYNGEKFLSETLESIINQKGFSDIEIVLCDDVSTDKSYLIAKYYSDKYSNISLYKNTNNLKMDGNFIKVASLGNGEYIWLCGQDDIIIDGAIAKVLNILSENPSIDFIYMNYKQADHNLEHVINDKMLKIENDVKCQNYIHFLSITKLTELPTLLPAFIMRKKSWDNIDPMPFYGTQYVQLGILLSLLDKINIYIVSFPYVIGRIPNDGWQQNNERLLDIISGNMDVITQIYRSNIISIPTDMYKNYCKQVKSIIVNILVDIKNNREKILNEKILGRLKFLFPIRYYYLKLFMIIPDWIFRTYKIKGILVRLIRLF